MRCKEGCSFSSLKVLVYWASIKINIACEVETFEMDDRLGIKLIVNLETVLCDPCAICVVRNTHSHDVSVAWSFLSVN